LQLSPDGILDERTIARGLSNLGRSADGTMQVYLHLKIPVSAWNMMLKTSGILIIRIYGFNSLHYSIFLIDGRCG
jgi:hypothetical protein